MRFFVLFLLIAVFGFSSAWAQDGGLEKYNFFIDDEHEQEISFQSYTTKFNDLIFDSDANSIIAKIDGDSALSDTVLVQLEKRDFDEIFSKDKKTLPTEILILLDGVEQEYEVVPTSLGDILIVWKFNTVPHIREIELIRNPNLDEKRSSQILSPLKQIKNGSPLHRIKCSADQFLVYKSDMTSVACVSLQAQTKLFQRGWGVNNIELSFQEIEEFLCDRYGGNWDFSTKVCEVVTKKQCSLMGGIFQNPLSCHDETCNNDKVICYTNTGNYYQQIEGKEISIEGVIIDAWGGTKHQYRFFTNEPYMKFNTGSSGIKLDGLNLEDGLNGKIVRIHGSHTERDLSIKVDDFEVMGSLFPTAKPTDDVIYDVTMSQLTDNPDLFYNQTIRLTGMLTEHENDLAVAGVGCGYATYTVSSEYVPDFPSSRHLTDGEQKIGVRIGSQNDLGRVKELLPSDYKENPVEIQGLFVPNLIEKGDCKHVIYKSGYLLTDMEGISILKPSSFYELKEDSVPFIINYQIKGGTVEEMEFSIRTNSLKIFLNSTGSGNLIISIPRNLLDARLDYCPPRFEEAPDDLFFVLVDKQEVDFDEILKTKEARTLKIPFQKNSMNIEIIGTCFV